MKASEFRSEDGELEELKRHLGPAAAKYSEVQLRKLIHELDRVAEFLLDLYFLKKKQKELTKDDSMPKSDEKSDVV